MARYTDTVIIGAGQAGLALSRCLSDMSVDHVVLDRGVVGQRWRTERWNSLRLLTPNWMTRLPGYSYQGSDPKGFMKRDQVVSFLEGYRQSFSAPVVEHTTVFSVDQHSHGYQVTTSNGIWFCRAVVVATGACDIPNVPRFARHLSSDIAQLTPSSYKSPADVADGGVLIVGASATGIQLAAELQAAGRQVTLAVGSHAPVPRRYRGRDIMEWLDDCEFLNDERPEASDPHKILRQPSLQLVGNTVGHSISLASVAESGVRLVGRVTNAGNRIVTLGDTLADDIATGQRRQSHILARVDHHILQHGLSAPAAEASETDSRLPISNPPVMDLRRRGVKTVIWATGYRRDYSWLNVPVLDRRGEICQTGGQTDLAGVYTLGLPFMRRRNSTFIDGVGADAQAIARSILTHLNQPAARAA